MAGRPVASSMANNTNLQGFSFVMYTTMVVNNYCTLVHLSVRKEVGERLCCKVSGISVQVLVDPVLSGVTRFFFNVIVQISSGCNGLLLSVCFRNYVSQKTDFYFCTTNRGKGINPLFPVLYPYYLWGKAWILFSLCAVSTNFRKGMNPMHSVTATIGKGMIPFSLCSVSTTFGKGINPFFFTVAYTPKFWQKHESTYLCPLILEKA